MNKPGPAEILRAAQKDKEFIERIEQELTDLVQQTFGQRFWLKWRSWLERSATLVYYALTNLAVFQTLGEEYTGLLQVDSTLRKLPSKKRIAVMVLLHTFGKLLSEKVFKHIRTVSSHENVLSSKTGVNRGISKNWLRRTGSKLVQLISMCLPFATQFHLTLFFFSGTFFHFSKRLTGIHYILVRKWFGNEAPNLKYLMWLSVFNLCLSLLRDIVGFIVARHERSSIQTSDELANQERCLKSIEEMENNGSLIVGKKCSLCLEVRRHPSVTPCGHIFCWECILDWLRTKQECPICRDQVAPSRVVPLQNYS